MKAYNDNIEAIKYVKSKVMKYQERVDEAQSKALDIIKEGVGDILDSNIEQENDDLREEGDQEPEEFVALDPENFIGAGNEAKNDCQ